MCIRETLETQSRQWTNHSTLTRVISFKQSAWLKGYIDMNTELRKKATNSVAKDMFKLLNNAIFGKTIEDVRNRRNVEFIFAHQWSRAVKHASHPWVKAWRVIIPDKLIAIEKARAVVVLDRPIIIGQAILDLSKLHMYNAWYNVIKAHFGKRVRLNYCDTDSFIYTVSGLEGKSLYRDYYEIQKKHDFFDLSELQNSWVVGDETIQNPLLFTEFEGPGSALIEVKAKNEKVLGKFKNEMKGVPIKSAVFLRPKMYSIELMADVIAPHHNLKKRLKGKNEPMREVAKKKGLPRSLPAEQERLHFSHESYRRIYFGGPTRKVEFPTLNHTKKLALYTGVTCKAGLAPLDDKLYWFNPASCLPYGHYFISQFEKRMARLRDEEAMVENLLQQAGKEDHPGLTQEVQDSIIRSLMEDDKVITEIEQQEYNALEDYLVGDDNAPSFH